MMNNRDALMLTFQYMIFVITIGVFLILPIIFCAWLLIVTFPIMVFLIFKILNMYE